MSRKVKVLAIDFIVSEGGVPSVLRGLLPRLEAHGVEVLWVDPLGSGVAATLEDAGVAVSQMRLWPLIPAIGWERPLRRYTIGLLSLFSHAILLLRLFTRLRHDETDIVYAHLRRGVVCAALLAPLLRARLVYHAHGCGHPSHVSGLFGWGVRRADRIIAVSGKVRDQLVEAGVPCERITVVHNGLDVDAWQKESERLLEPLPPKQAGVILIAAALHPGKGHAVLLRAFASLASQFAGWEVWVAGDTGTGGDAAYAEGLVTLADELAIGDRVRWLGHRQDMAAVMSKADILVAPSTVEESFGMVLIEAMALGKPVVASRIGGMPEVVLDGVTGILVPANAPDALAAPLQELMGNPCARARFGHAGRQRVLAAFSLGKQAANVAHELCTVDPIKRHELGSARFGPRTPRSENH